MINQKYSNPLPAENINVSQQHPLKEALGLSAALIVIILLLGFIFEKSLEYIAPYIPFSTEASLMDGNNLFPNDDPEVSHALQKLADKLIKSINAPKDVVLHIHYSSADTVNAMATLGGHIVIYRGLLERMPHENALAMVLSHEIAHVLHRDPLRAAGRGVLLSLLMTSLGLNVDMLSPTTVMQAMHYSRDYERHADATALHILQSYYGSTNGAADLFRVLSAEKSKHHRDENGELWEFLQSHPLIQKRIHVAEKEVSSTAQTTPLPTVLQINKKESTY